MPRPIRPALVGLAAAALAGIALSGAAALAADRVLRVGEMWDIATLDPARSGTFIREKALVVETLVEAGPDFTLRPGLAVSWTREDPLNWLFELRPGVTFHDGSVLTAEIAAESLRRALEAKPATASTTRIAGVEAAGELALRVTTAEPYPALPASLVLSDTAIVHPDSPRLGDGSIDTPIGTGPYRIGRWRPSAQTLDLERNEGYWGAPAALAAVQYRAMPDPTTRSLEILKGDVDFVADVPFGDLDYLASQGLSVVREQTARIYHLDFGAMEGTPWEDPRVRKALSLAIDRHAIAEHVLMGVGAPAIGPFAPHMDFANRALQPDPFDPEAARALLAEAGWTDLDGDGVVSRDGRAFAVTLFTYPQRPGLVPMATAIQSQLAAIGIQAELRVADWSAIPQARQPQDLRLGAFATALFPDPDFFLRQFFHSEGVSNAGGYASPAVDDLLDRARTAFEAEDRRALFDQVQAILAEDRPTVTIAYYGVNVVMRPDLQNFAFNPVAHDYMLTTDMHFAPTQ